MLSISRVLPLSRLTFRTLSTSSPVTARRPSKPYREERVVMTNDGTVIACWHPQPKFPYELSQPISRSETVAIPSPLKVQVTEDMKELYHHKHERFHRRDLMRLTGTTKHKWFGGHDKRRAEMNERKNPREKPYL